MLAREQPRPFPIDAAFPHLPFHQERVLVMRQHLRHLNATDTGRGRDIHQAAPGSGVPEVSETPGALASFGGPCVAGAASTRDTPRKPLTTRSDFGTILAGTTYFLFSSILPSCLIWA